MPVLLFIMVVVWLLNFFCLTNCKLMYIFQHLKLMIRSTHWYIQYCVVNTMYDTACAYM